MIIDFACSGGFSTLNLTYHTDTARLKQSLTHSLETAVNDSRFFDIPESSLESLPYVLPDTFVYSLAITDAEKKKVLHLNEIAIPESLKPLLSLLEKLAREEAILRKRDEKHFTNNHRH